MSLQVIVGPDGEIVVVSRPLPGAVHDLAAARIWGIIRELAASGLVVPADKGASRRGLPRHAVPGTVSYLHMHKLVALRPSARVGRCADAAVDRWDDRGRIGDAAGRVATGRRGAGLSWALLVAGSVASLAVNVAVAEPTLTGRVVPAWPSLALTASCELLTRQVRSGVSADGGLVPAAGPAVRDVVSG